MPTAGALLGSLAGSGAYTQQILQNLAPALAGKTGSVFPLGPQISTDVSPVSPATSSPAADPGFNAYDQAGY